VTGFAAAPAAQPLVSRHIAGHRAGERTGSIIAFSQNSDDPRPDGPGIICSFGAGYSVGSVIVERRG